MNAAPTPTRAQPPPPIWPPPQPVAFHPARPKRNWPEQFRQHPVATAVLGLLVLGAIVSFAVNGAKGSGSGPAAAQPASSAELSKCDVGGRTVLTGIPVDATQFRFKFIGGGFTGHEWHTDWLPNDSEVKGGTYWIYTLGDQGTTPSGVTGEVQMSDGSTVETDQQLCY